MAGQKKVEFNADNCDWRQWAMMIWALLQTSQEQKIYEGKVQSCPFPFLEDILTGKTMDWDLLSSAELVCRLEMWLHSDAFKIISDGVKALGASTIAAQVKDAKYNPLNLRC